MLLLGTHRTDAAETSAPPCLSPPDLPHSFPSPGQRLMRQDLLVSFPCGTTGHPAVGRFRAEETGWVLVGASRQRPGTEIPAADGPRGAVQGVFEVGDEFRGCPSCGNTGIVRCGRCGHLTCWDGTDSFHCPTCGNVGHVAIGGINSVADFGKG